MNVAVFIQANFFRRDTHVRSREMLSLPVILALAAILRLSLLGQAPLWGDEAATAGFAALPWHDLFFGIGRLEPNPPAFYALEKLWIGLAGGSDLMLRLPSALFGMAGVAAIWVVSRLAFGVRAAGWAALMLAIQAQHLEFSREARGYSLLFLTLALAVVAARQVAASHRFRNGSWPALALAVLGATAMSLHHTGIIGLVCVFVYAFVLAWRLPGFREIPRLHGLPAMRLCLLMLAGLGALTAAIPALLAMAAIARDGANNAAWIPVPDFWMTAVFTLSVLSSPLRSLRDFPPGMGLAFMALGLVVIGWTVVYALRRFRTSPDAAAMLLALGAAILLMAGISQFKPIMIERTLLFSLIFFIPLLGATLATSRPVTRLVMLALIMTAQAPGLAQVYLPLRHGEDWPALAAQVSADAAASGWTVIVPGGFEAVSVERYLPAATPVPRIVALSPVIGAQLNEAVAKVMSSAVALPLDATPAALCTAIGRQGGALLVLRQNVTLDVLRPAIASLLTIAGGVFTEKANFGLLRIERWSGVCASPAPIAAP